MEPEYSSKPREQDHSSNEEPRRDYVVEQTLSPEEIDRLFAVGDRLADAIDRLYEPRGEVDMNTRFGSSYVPRSPEREEMLAKVAEVRQRLKDRFRPLMRIDGMDLKQRLRA